MSDLSKKIVSGALTATTGVWMSGALMLVPVAHGQSIADLQLQIQGLLEQIQQLTTQLNNLGGTTTPTVTTCSVLVMVSPSGPSFIHSTVVMMVPSGVRLTAIWASQAPVKLVCPRGRLPSVPQWWTIRTAHPKASRMMSAALM